MTRDVMMSIHPRHAEAILSGEKRFEFRRRIWASGTDVGAVYIYATSPVSAVVGVFDCGRIHETFGQDARWLWTQTMHRAGITREEFFSYFAGASSCYAISVLNARRLSPQPLSAFGLGRPPQSWQYLEATE